MFELVTAFTLACLYGWVYSVSKRIAALEKAAEESEDESESFPTAEERQI